MTQDQVIEITRALGICELTSKPKQDIHYSLTIHEMQEFAKLVAQHEREACASICEELKYDGYEMVKDNPTLARKIRARAIMDDKEHKVGEYIPMPNQEPVGWAENGVINWLADKQFKHTSFLYDTPADRKWMSLTDKEIEKCWQAAIKLNNGKGADITNQPFYFLAKIVEELLMEKNA